MILSSMGVGRILRYTKDECPLDIVNDLAQDLSLSLLTEQDIDGIHRLPSKPDCVAPILKVSRRTKENW